MTYNATDRKAIKRREKEAKQREQQRLNYTRSIMSDRFGREWMHQLLESTCMFHSPFVLGSPDATALNIGRQEVGRQLLADITNAAPEDYNLMIREARTREAANDRRDSDNRSPADQHPGSPDTGGDTQGPVASDYDPFAGDEVDSDA